MSASSFCVSSPMMPRYLLPRLAVERDLRHRQRFRVAANRGERRHELVRHVRQELTACAIGCRQRCRARAEIVGHPVERVRERADLVASALRRAHVRASLPEVPRRLLQRPQPAVRRAEDEERRARGTRGEERERDPRQRRTDLANRHEDRRRGDRHHHDAHLVVRDDDRGALGSSGRAVRRHSPRAAAAADVRGVRIVERDSAPEPLLHAARITRREARRTIGRRPAVAHHDEERPVDVPEVIGDVRLERQVRIFRKCSGELVRDRRDELLGRPRRAADDAIGEPEEEEHLRDEDRREGRDEPERDAPVKALVPNELGHL